MTLPETWSVFRAAVWRMRSERDRDMRIAWHTAAFQRAKRMPNLKRLLSTFRTRKLAGEELAQRQAEHEEMARKMMHGR